VRVQTVESHRIYRLTFTGLESPVKGIGPEEKQVKVPENVMCSSPEILPRNVVCDLK